MAPYSTHVIIGAGAAGLSAACAILKINPGHRVSLLSEEKDKPYFRPMIPFIISGKKEPSDVAMIGQGPYVQEGFDLLTGRNAVKIKPVEKQVMMDDGQTLSFDRLLIASGGTPYLPPDIEGLNSEGVYALRTLSQSRYAAKRSLWARHAVMLGGGLLNLKAAFALLEKGIDVTLVVYSPEILSQLMTPEDAIMIRNALEKAGLKVMTGCSARKIVDSGKGVSSVVLDNGKELKCDMVFIGKGVRPCVAFLKDSGIEIDSGVVVDRYTKSNLDDIYAAGDVAVTFDPITGKRIVTGLWTNAAEMGACAGKNMAGNPTAYSGTFGVMNATQVAGLPFVSMGLVHPGEDDVETYKNISDTSYRKLVFSKDGKYLLGLVMIGDIKNAGLYRFIMREKKDIRSLKHKIIGQTLTSADVMY